MKVGLGTEVRAGEQSSAEGAVWTVGQAAGVVSGPGSGLHQEGDFVAHRVQGSTHEAAARTDGRPGAGRRTSRAEVLVPHAG